MKIIFVNPRVDAGRKIAAYLKEKGLAVLSCTDPNEAWQLFQLHRTSVDLLIVHRENADSEGQAGLEFVEKLREKPEFANLPYILTTSKWSDEDCVQHQKTSAGANAYFPSDFRDAISSAAQIYELVQAVLDMSPVAEGSSSQGFDPPPPPEAGDSSEPLLEDATPMFSAAELEGDSKGEISLEAPEPTNSELVNLPSLTKGEEEPVPSAPLVEAQPPRPPVFKGKTSSIDVEQMPAFDLTTYDDSVKKPSPLPKEPDREAVEKMPYVFEDRGPLMAFAVPLGDAVVPGGAAQSPDLEVLKKYLLLREQDVATLSSQLKSMREQVTQLEVSVSLEKARNVELTHVVDEQRKRLENFEEEKSLALDSYKTEIENLRFQLKTKHDKIRVMEVQVKRSADEVESLKERVRTDIRKIRVREKDLENRVEILKKDSEVLLTARESKIIDLKRKLDLTEFNLDLMQDRFEREKAKAELLNERLAKAARAMRVAGGFLDEEPVGGPSTGQMTTLPPDTPGSTDSEEKTQALEIDRERDAS